MNGKLIRVVRKTDGFENWISEKIAKNAQEFAKKYFQENIEEPMVKVTQKMLKDANCDDGYTTISKSKSKKSPTQNSKEPFITDFDTQEQAKDHYNKNLKEKMKGRGPNKIKPNDEGFYEATIRSNTKIYTWEEVIAEKKYGLTNNNYRLYPCYKDITDKSTLKWYFIHH